MGFLPALPRRRQLAAVVVLAAALAAGAGHLRASALGGAQLQVDRTGTCGTCEPLAGAAAALGSAASTAARD